MPKVSIITTTYNHEKFIVSTIESVISQSFTDWELLIGDDSLDDATWDIIQGYVAKYPQKIRAWHHAPNKGIVANMDFLIDRISPSVEYISFLEGDDRYTPDNLFQKIQIFQQIGDVDIICSDYVFIDSKGQRTGGGYRGSLPLDNTKKYSSASEVTGIPFSWSTGACRKEVYVVWQKRRFLPKADKRYSVSDYDFYFQGLFSSFRIYMLDMILVEYRWHADNLSIVSPKIPEDLRKLYCFYKDSHMISEREYKDFMVQNTYILAGTYSILGKKLQSLMIFYKERRFLRSKHLLQYIKVGIMFFIPSQILSNLYRKRIINT